MKAETLLFNFLKTNLYFKKHIALFIHNEKDGFRYLDSLAEHLSKKYSCDAVRELCKQIALDELNDESTIECYSVFYRNGKKFIIPDNGIEDNRFEIKIIKELKN